MSDLADYLSDSPARRKPRKSVSKKVRFEVFKRDSFTCQYCGKKAPDVVLHVDHIQPVSGGGKNDILNLVTACEGCNSGKGSTPLDDTSALAKRRHQGEALQERREQIQMMADWHKGLLALEDASVDAVAELWKEVTCDQYHLNDSGRTSAKSLIRQFGISEVMEAMPLSAAAYFKYEDGRITSDSVNKAFNKLGGICYNRRRWRDNPGGELGEKLMWEFVNLYREMSLHPPNWRLTKWWKSIHAAKPQYSPREWVGTIRTHYKAGNFGSYWAAALDIWDDEWEGNDGA